MEQQFYKSTGISLSVGSLLAIVTMILHPSGGNIMEIVKQAEILKVSHSIAIICLPFMLFGFYGLSKSLSENRKLSTLALVIVAFGLFAAMLAALFNGIILPNFLSKNLDILEESKKTISVIVSYGFSINKALDYVFIVSLIAAIGLYSWLMIRLRNRFSLIGYFGMIILLLTLISLVLNFAITSLFGFRFFVLSITVWILLSGFFLIKAKN
ncbi:conserved membrane hypothetical protein [Tenacibaculum sp. 190524A05c]|uniref:hypothetical protein n=1 Tax=Tenacibaculum platacis TaxID=3137852 RepID=UPI0031FA9BA7